MKTVKAFTLVELLLCVVIGGILLLMILPNGSKGKSMSEVSTMKAKAVLLNSAQISYIEAVGTPTAVTTWAAQGTDDAKYQLIKPYLQFPPASLSAFVLNGYTVTFASDPRQPVTLQQGSTTLSYN